MNLANRLTLLRIVLIPFFLVFMYLNIPFAWLYAAVIFTVASITDVLDGYVARKEKKVTVFGKVFDPIADKLLVIAALVVFSERDILPSLVTIFLISREIFISGFRIVISTKKGEVISASWLGKTKTVLQDVAVVLYLVRDFSVLQVMKAVYLPEIVMGAAVIFTLWSTIDYVVVNRNNFSIEE